VLDVALEGSQALAGRLVKTLDGVRCPFGPRDGDAASLDLLPRLHHPRTLEGDLHEALFGSR
jgi:hypothetical protein